MRGFLLIAILIMFFLQLCPASAWIDTEFETIGEKKPDKPAQGINSFDDKRVSEPVRSSHVSYDQRRSSNKATIYIAGMGGHFAVADVTIDPTSSVPIQLNRISKLDIGTSSTHPLHDVRIDANNRNLMYWSTYKIDKKVGGPHVGVADLVSGKVIKDVVASIPRAGQRNTKSLYAGSGQTEDYYFPITMTNKAYIDVFRKSDMRRLHSVFLEGTEADPGVPYKFYHGINSPDMKRMLITFNEADRDHGKPVGRIHLMLFDAKALESGRVKLLKRAVISGNAGRTISFRSSFSSDGKLIALSGADTLYIIDAKTLKIKNTQPMGKLEENHDAMFTPDGKYVIASIRIKALNKGNASTISRSAPYCNEETFNGRRLGKDDYTMDGQLKLYDVGAKKFIGKSTSVCLSCHNDNGPGVHAVLAGIDANFK